MKTKNDNGISELKFEEAMEELETIIDRLEGGEPTLTLEESLELYKRGVLLSQHCKQALQRAQQEVNILSKNLEGDLVEIPFQGEDHV
ncbi:MAG: exodeoxyribonuclease VII small subunit [Caldicoprobacterales bacterium]|jgi:exodeoxyribonuclease VII small subunit|nr:exodeoxyribonuclease VII small subunit [Clostridiales bacterium]